MNEIYQMKLHDQFTDTINAVDIRIMRVPGGWIYTTFVEGFPGNFREMSCFVPYNDEFKIKMAQAGSNPA